MEGTNISVLYNTEFFIAMENEDHPKHQLAVDVWTKTATKHLVVQNPEWDLTSVKTMNR